MGRLFRNKINAYFAFFIGVLPIDPLLSKRKKYSPLAESILVSKLSAFNASFLASYRFNVQNFGIKDTITLEALSVLPSV
jgi:hypothetical protein